VAAVQGFSGQSSARPTNFRGLTRIISARPPKGFSWARGRPSPAEQATLRDTHPQAARRPSANRRVDMTSTEKPCAAPATQLDRRRSACAPWWAFKGRSAILNSLRPEGGSIDARALPVGYIGRSNGSVRILAVPS